MKTNRTISLGMHTLRIEGGEIYVLYPKAKGTCFKGRQIEQVSTEKLADGYKVEKFF